MESCLDVVSVLLNQKANIEARGNLQMTPLMWASQRGHAPVVSLLLGRQADIHARGDQQQTALHLACDHGCQAKVALLLARDGHHNVRFFGK